MNGVLGMASLLAETELDEDQALFACTISEFGASLMMIIDDIPNFFKIDARQVVLREAEFDLNQLLHSIVVPMQ